MLHLAIKDIVMKHVFVQFNATNLDYQTTQDGVIQYAMDLLSMGMFFLEFHDAI